MLRCTELIIEDMKKTILFVAALFLLLVSMTSPIGNINIPNPFKPKSVSLSFNYLRQDGPGSNQYAVWVENEKGEVVKTLFVTSFTTKGRLREGEQLVRGYVKRPACVPTWVEHAHPELLSDQDLDAFTGATPRSGNQTFKWDFKDAYGMPVPNGKYTIYLEATLFNESSVLYAHEFMLPGKRAKKTLTAQAGGNDQSHRKMVSDVKVRLR